MNGHVQSRQRNKKVSLRKLEKARTAACVKNLEELHEKYVLVPADKSGNNVIVICM